MGRKRTESKSLGSIHPSISPSIHPSIRPSIHPSTRLPFSWTHQPAPTGDPKGFSGQCGDIISPPGPGSVLGPSPRWTCLKHPQQAGNREADTRCPENTSTGSFQCKEAAALLRLDPFFITRGEGRNEDWSIDWSGLWWRDRELCRLACDEKSPGCWEWVKWVKNELRIFLLVARD